MNNDFNGNQMPQQPMPQPQPMQQPMQQPMYANQPMPGAAPKGKNPAVLIAGVVAAIIVVVLLFFMISTKTYSCKTKIDEDGQKGTSLQKITFRFGKPVSTYQKSVVTFDDKDEAKEYKELIDSIYKDGCKKKDGCTYSAKVSGKKLTLVIKEKLDEDDQERFEKQYDSVKEFKKDFKDECKEKQDK